jgi:D-alanine-D-alanine ligase
MGYGFARTWSQAGTAVEENPGAHKQRTIMAQRIRVGVIFGGRSGEHEVSLVSATSIIHALDRVKYEVVPIGIAPDGRWISSPRALSVLKQKAGLENEPEQFLVPEPNRRALIAAEGAEGESLPIDVVFPVIHGTYGEDGTLQGLLELANIPYVGAGVLGSAVGMDKIAQKQILQQAGFPVAKYLTVLSSDYETNPRRVCSAVEEKFSYPLFVKPANTGSSVGISKVHSRKELLPALDLAAGYDRRLIIERAVPQAREIECAVLGNDKPEASVLGEIVPSNEFYDYEAKYVDGKSRAFIPAPLPKAVTAKIRSLAVRAFLAIDCAGMARVDFFVTRRTHRIWLNELNTIPGFTSISMYPKLWQASGISYSTLLDRLITLAIDRHRQKNRLTRVYQPARDWYRQE